MNLQINSMTEKKAKSGQIYWVAETTAGKMNVWDAGLHKELFNSAGKIVDVEITENKGFKNISKINSVLAGAGATNQSASLFPAPDKSLTMYVSYAKDIFIALLGYPFDEKENEKPSHSVDNLIIMNEAIKLIKQAKEGLKE